MIRQRRHKFHCRKVLVHQFQTMTVTSLPPRARTVASSPRARILHPNLALLSHWCIKSTLSLLTCWMRNMILSIFNSRKTWIRVYSSQNTSRKRAKQRKINISYIMGHPTPSCSSPSSTPSTRESSRHNSWWNQKLSKISKTTSRKGSGPSNSRASNKPLSTNAFNTLSRPYSLRCATVAF